MVQNNSRNALVAMIRINGNDHLLKEGSVVSGVQVKKVLPDSVLICKQREGKFFRIIKSN